MESPSPILAMLNTIPIFAEILKRDNLLSDERLVSNAFFKETVIQNHGVIDCLFRYHHPPSCEPTDYKAYLILQLGPGISGQPGIAHGGFLATVMDEVTGGLIGATGLDNGYGMFTMSIKMDYLKPVQTPGIIMAEANISRIEGRKTFLKAYIKDELGAVCTEAEVLYISKRPSKS